MNNSTLKNLLTDYEKKHLNAIYDADHRKQLLYKQNPRLQEIDDTLSKEAIEVTKQMISNPNQKLLDQLNQDIEKLKKEKLSILEKLGKDENYLKPHFECSICQDTGI